MSLATARSRTESSLLFSTTQPGANSGVWHPFLFKIPHLCDSVRCGGFRTSFEVGRRQVIELTRINGEAVTVNSDLILFVESAPELSLIHI